MRQKSAKKTVVSLLLAGSLLLGNLNVPAAEAKTDPHYSKNGILTVDDGVMREDMDTFDLIHEMGLGINLGNTMEACGTWIDSSSVYNYETAWGAPITSQAMITGMKNAGFSSIRIPVAWSNMMSEDGKYKINNAYFDRVETIMNYAFNEGMYVIINIHFDSGWWARFGSWNAAEREQAMAKYKAMWQQIADRYEEYSDYLIFESANEELGARLNSTDDYAGSGYFTSEDQLYQMTNEINQTFVNIIRNSGGNNPTRHLLIAGYDTDISKTCDSRYQMPTDTIDGHLMVSVHYYSPSTYCIVSDPNNSWGYQDSWGTADDIAAMKAELNKMKITFANQGYPVIIGEYGVCDSDTTGRKSGRDVFFETLCTYALQNGMCPVLWDIGQIYSRNSCSMLYSVEAQTYLQLQQLAKNTPVYVPGTGKTTLTWKGSISYSGWVPSDITADGNSDFVINAKGACYAITGVDWSKYESPVLKISATGINSSILYMLGKTVNTSNEYWYYFENSEIENFFNPSQGVSIDLSGLNLSGSQTLYFAFGGAEQFSGNFTLEITE